MLAPSPTGDDMQAGEVVPTAPGHPIAQEQGTEPHPAPTRMTKLRTTVNRLLRCPQLWSVCIALCIFAICAALISPHLRAWYHLRAARSELQHWHNGQAIRHLQICRRAWPQDADVLLLAAQASRRARGYAEAERLLEMYQQARGLDDACTLEQLLLSAERQVDQVVETCWHHVDQGHPDSPLILEALTRGYLRQYRISEARSCLDRWREIEPDNAHVSCLEGLLYLDYAHTQTAALECFRRAVELDPDHEEACQGLAVSLITARNFAEAIQHLDRLLRIKPDNPSLKVGLAECYDGLGEDAEAIRLVDEVLAQQPDFAPALSLRARLAMKNGDSVEAERLLRQAIKINPIDHRTRYSLMLCLHQNGKEDEERQMRKQFEQLEEDLAHFNEIVTKDLAARPRDPALHCTLGKLLLRAGQREEGLRWLQSALRIDPHYAPARKVVEEYQNTVKAEVSAASSPAK